MTTAPAAIKPLPPLVARHRYNRLFTTSQHHHIDILDTSKQQPSKSSSVKEPTALTEEQYHELADEYLEELLFKLEQLQEIRNDLEVEYAAGVLNVELPSQGTYVLNKQPPNKQIWLSSPLSGPKRYDWVLEGNIKHTDGDGAKGDWVYLRDGTSLTELLRREIGVEMEIESSES